MDRLMPIDLQIEYKQLENEINKDRNHILNEDRRKRFYYLHQTVEKPNEAVLFKQINALIDQKRKNYKFLFGASELEEERLIFNFLEKKRNSTGLDRFEYNFLTYLITKNGHLSIVNNPQIPAEILDKALSNFSDEFAYNDSRKYLLATLMDVLSLSMQLFKIENIDFFVGGGYLDLDNSQPKDIDIILLLPSKLFMGDLSNRKKEKILANSGTLIDLYKLPIDYDIKIYMAYELMTLVSNKSNLVTSITNNYYVQRRIFRLNYFDQAKQFRT